MNTLPIKKLTPSVKEVLTRDILPPVPTKFCKKEQNLLQTITDVANEIHKKSLRGPAEFIVINKEQFNIINFLTNSSSASKIIKNLKEFSKHNKNDSAEFADATHVGILNNRYCVYESSKMPKNKILIGRFGEGFEYKLAYVRDNHYCGLCPTDECDCDREKLPVIDLVVTNNPLYYKGEISFWGYVEYET